MSDHFDVVIVGQGLAGTTLAWYLRWMGNRILIADRESKVTPSKIAAGLLTPITGQKLIPTWRHRELWPEAISFYDRVEKETAAHFFRQTAMVRIFANEAEASLFSRKQATGAFDGIAGHSPPIINTDWFAARQSVFEMLSGGQLNVPAYLSESRHQFLRDGSYVASDLIPAEDILLRGDRVEVSRLNVTAGRIVFCQGFEAQPNPWFREVQFKPAKGEILTLRIPGLAETRVFHQGVWLAPLGNELFKVGATYDWKNLDSIPTAGGCDEITFKLKQFLRLPFEKVFHDAAVRPIHRNQYPVLGVHPQFPQLAFFNGLGSKGSLHAPYFAKQLATHLIEGRAVDVDVDLNRKTKWTGTASWNHDATAFHVKRSQLPLTQQAQNAVRSVAIPGDFVIDATMGNGYDTEFLANLVGPTGTVFAFDLQQAALEKTGRRLAVANLHNVRLFNWDHARMAEMIPERQRGMIGSIMFNLGYLPGGDKQMTTSVASTRLAIQQAARLLRPRGIITILAYTGHDGGAAEANAVADELEGLSKSDFEIETIESVPGNSSGPRMFVVRRLSPDQ